MSHDFEPTDAEKEMLSYMKDIEVNQKQTELGEIISGAILDGQNQIHDLYKEKATSQQIEYRMRRAYIYWMDRLNKANDHQLQKAEQRGEERMKRAQDQTDEYYKLRLQKALTSHSEAIRERVEQEQRKHNCPPDDDNDYDQGAWEAFDRVLALLNDSHV